MKTIKVFLTNGTTVEGFLSKWTKKKLVLISNAGAKLTIYKPYKYVMMIKDISEMQVPNLLPNTQTKQQQSVGNLARLISARIKRPSYFYHH